MRKKFSFHFQGFLTTAIFLLALPVLAQEVPQVPRIINFADMTLHLTEQAQRDIQADVDALYRSPKYFNLKLERVDMYLPIIEPILAEHGVPDEIKYLVIQESALISDAVSSSNAVGFWQFKEASATEVGMRIDRQVDERMNIVSSTNGAARYLLRSNATFNNWLYSIQSYQMGLGGATRALPDRYYGAQEMRIDGDTYWYVKKFLSHLVAFRDAVGKQPRNFMLYQYKNGANKDLELIAQEFNTDPEQLKEYNKWLKISSVPDDRPYVVMVPVHLDEAPNLLAESQATADRNKDKSLEDRMFGEKQKQPELPAAERDKLAITQVNGIRAAVARPGDNARDLAKAGGISVANFLKFNDIKPGDALKQGQVYYFKKKKKRAAVYRHVVAEGESLWDVSQKYGVRLDKLLQKNRMRARDKVKPGQVVWLRYIRPANEPVTFEPVPQQKALVQEKPASTLLAQAPQSESKNIVQTAAREPAPIATAKAEREETAQKKPAVVAAKPVTAEDHSQQQNVLKPAVVQPPQQAATQPAAVKSEATEAAHKNNSPEKSQDRETGFGGNQVKAPEAVVNNHSPLKQQELPETEVQQSLTKSTPSAATVKVVADTPVVKKAAVMAPSQAAQKDTTALTLKDSASLGEHHLYPGNINGQSNVFPKNTENPGQTAAAAIAQPMHKPDSFAIQGPVKFIGEDGLELQAPIRTATAETSLPDRETQGLQQPVQNASSQPQPKTAPLQPVVQDSVHLVKAGETLYSISRQYGITVQQLRERNRMANDAVLSIGQELQLKAVATPNAKVTATVASASVIPKTETTKPETTVTTDDNRNIYHTVAEGETMYRVARKYNVTIKDIMEWNRKEDFNIKPGEILVVSRK